MLEEKTVLNHISESVVTLELEKVLTTVNEALFKGISTRKIILEGLGKGMEQVGSKFASGEFFLSELIFAGHIMEKAATILDQHVDKEPSKTEGKVLIATAEGDLHDIGKNIVISMLKSAGFEIIDLGVDVEAEKIVKNAEEKEADIIAISALLSVVVPYVEKTVQAIRDSRIGSKVKVLLGGRALDAERARKMGADAYARDAWEGVAKAKMLISQKKKT
jgi:methylmalonyl-CoA mutase cobalamin-binding domain/chain